MEYLTEHVEEKIREELPDKSTLVIDGWTTADTHYIGLFVCFPRKEEAGYKRVLLAFSPLLDETRMDADEHFNFIDYHLGLFDKTTDNIVSLTGDNCSNNKALANKLSCYFVGCASHRFNLAINDYIIQHETTIDMAN